MNLNVFSWSFPARFYLLRPWKWFKELGRNCRDAYHRIRYGYCKSDIYNMDNWMLAILPSMLEDIAASDIGAYPGIEPFETPEKWQAWLCERAQIFRSLQDDWTITRNEYEQAWFEDMQNSRVEHSTVNNGKVVSFDNADKELYDKYLARARELGDLQQKTTEENFAELSKHFYQLWI